MEQGNSQTYLKFWKETNSYLFLSQKHLNKYKYDRNIHLTITHNW